VIRHLSQPRCLFGGRAGYADDADVDAAAVDDDDVVCDV